MDKVIIPRVEMAVRSITDSSAHGHDSVIENPDRYGFAGNAKNTPRLSASSRLDSNIDQNRIDETRDIENFKNCDFLALKPNCDRKAHAHHSRLSPILVIRFHRNFSLLL